MIKSDHLAITKLNAFPGAYGKSSGVQNDRLEPLAKMDATEKSVSRFLPPVSARS
jgi:hypothetical protein